MVSLGEKEGEIKGHDATVPPNNQAWHYPRIDLTQSACVALSVGCSSAFVFRFSFFVYRLSFVVPLISLGAAFALDAAA
jgi:hypothetical protein